MNVHRGQGMHFPTHHGSKVFLNRSIYHARKRLTRLNIRISDTSRMGFVQLSASISFRGTYALWKFENSGCFLPSKTGLPRSFSAPAAKMRQIFSFFSSDFSHLSQNRPRPRILYGSIKRWMNAELWALALNVRRSAFAFLLLSIGLFSDHF